LQQAPPSKGLKDGTDHIKIKRLWKSRDFSLRDETRGKPEAHIDKETTARIASARRGEDGNRQLRSNSPQQRAESLSSEEASYIKHTV